MKKIIILFSLITISVFSTNAQNTNPYMQKVEDVFFDIPDTIVVQNYKLDSVSLKVAKAFYKIYREHDEFDLTESENITMFVLREYLLAAKKIKPTGFISVDISRRMMQKFNESYRSFDSDLAQKQAEFDDFMSDAKMYARIKNKALKQEKKAKVSFKNQVFQ